MYKKERKKYYRNLDPKSITDTKRFWQTIKPFFQIRVSKRNITLIDTIIYQDTDVANTLNAFFDNAVRTLEINVSTECLNDVQGISDSIHAAIQKYTNHPSSLKISETVDRMKFSFKEIVNSDIEAEIKNLNLRKANTFKNIPAKLLKDNRDVCNEPLFNIINNGIKDSMFDEGLKSADITLVHKKGDKTDDGIIVLSMCFQYCQKSLKESSKNRLASIWKEL